MHATHSGLHRTQLVHQLPGLTARRNRNANLSLRSDFLSPQCPSSKQDECVAAVHVTQLKGDRKAVSLAQMWACGSVRTERPRDASITPSATCVRVVVGGAGPMSARSLTGPLRLAPRHKPGMFI